MQHPIPWQTAFATACLAAPLALAQPATPAGPTAQSPAASQGSPVAAPAATAAAAPAPAQPAAGPRAAAPAAPAAGKDVVLDQPAPAPAKGAPHGPALALSLGDLGSTLLADTARPGSNAVVSPLSVATAIGLLQVGAKGVTAQELGRVLDSGASKGRRFSSDMPALVGLLQGDKAARAPLIMASRIWVDQRVTETAAPSFQATARQRWKADGAVLSFASAEPARNTINQWVATHTAQQIKEVLPPGSISGNTRFVVTNAVHFKAPWAEPFEARLTRPAAFKVEGKGTVQVPTLHDERPVAWARLPSGETFMELPFEGRQYSLLLLMPAPGAALAEAVRELQGASFSEAVASLRPQNCQLRLPKFKISGAAASLKASLQGMGVRAAFSDGADFSELLGRKSDAKLDEVYHAATFEIDEAGGEASAATAAVAVAKGFAAPAPECAVDRPFVFALMHKPSGAPLFVGQVANPADR